MFTTMRLIMVFHSISLNRLSVWFIEHRTRKEIFLTKQVFFNKPQVYFVDLIDHCFGNRISAVHCVDDRVGVRKVRSAVSLINGDNTGHREDRCNK